MAVVKIQQKEPTAFGCWFTFLSSRSLNFDRKETIFSWSSGVQSSYTSSIRGNLTSYNRKKSAKGPFFKIHKYFQSNTFIIQIEVENEICDITVKDCHWRNPLGGKTKEKEWGVDLTKTNYMHVQSNT